MIQSLTYLKGKFETGDTPTQQDFIDLFDSLMHYTETLGAYQVLKRDDTSGAAAGLTVPSSTLVGRKDTGGIAALSVSEVQALIGAGFPAGIVLPFAGSDVPDGWLLCDGSAIDRTTYAGLFTAIGETYGEGDGSTTFNLPDMTGRAPAGADDTHVLGTQYGAATFDASHDHTVTPNAVSIMVPAEGTPTDVADHTEVTTSEASITVDTIPPSLALNFIIKY